MASPVDVCNIALSHLGARAQISAISPPDGSVEAGYCARFYPIARREVIEAGSWSFAKTRATLAEVDNTSDVWAYAYALPSNCVKARRVLQLQYLNAVTVFWPAGSYTDEYSWHHSFDQCFNERGTANFDIEDGVLRTNEPDAVLLYTKDVTDTARWSPLMTSAVGMVLAGYLAGPIIKGKPGADTGVIWREQGFAMVARALAADGNAGSESAEYLPASIAARG